MERTVQEIQISRSLMMCASPGCFRKVHVDPSYGGYCCYRCWMRSALGSKSKSKNKHGETCQDCELPVNAIKADRGWLPEGAEEHLEWVGRSNPDISTSASSSASIYHGVYAAPVQRLQTLPSDAPPQELWEKVWTQVSAEGTANGDPTDFMYETAKQKFYMLLQEQKNGQRPQPALTQSQARNQRKMGRPGPPEIPQQLVEWVVPPPPSQDQIDSSTQSAWSRDYSLQCLPHCVVPGAHGVWGIALWCNMCHLYVAVIKKKDGTYIVSQDGGCPHFCGTDYKDLNKGLEIIGDRDAGYFDGPPSSSTTKKSASKAPKSPKTPEKSAPPLKAPPQDWSAYESSKKSQARDASEEDWQETWRDRYGDSYGSNNARGCPNCSHEITDVCPTHCCWVCQQAPGEHGPACARKMSAGRSGQDWGGSQGYAANAWTSATNWSDYGHQGSSVWKAYKSNPGAAASGNDLDGTWNNYSYQVDNSHWQGYKSDEDHNPRGRSGNYDEEYHIPGPGPSSRLVYPGDDTDKPPLTEPPPFPNFRGSDDSKAFLDNLNGSYGSYVRGDRAPQVPRTHLS